MGVLLFLIALYTRLLLGGKLVPQEVADRQVSDRDDTIADLREQVSAYQKAERLNMEANAELRRQVSDLIATGLTTSAVLEAIREKAQEGQ